MVALANRMTAWAKMPLNDGLWKLGCVFGAATKPAYPCILSHWIKLSGGGHSVTWTGTSNVAFGGFIIQLDEDKKYVNYANGQTNRTITLDSRTVYLGISSLYDDGRYEGFTLYDNTDSVWLFNEGKIADGHDGGLVEES